MNILYRPNSLLKNATRQKLIVISDSETLCPVRTHAWSCWYFASSDRLRCTQPDNTHRPTPMTPRVDSYMVVYVYKKYATTHTQQTWVIHPILFHCWSTVFDAGPTLKQHRVNASCCWSGSSPPGALYRQSVPLGGNLPKVMTVGLPSCRPNRYILPTPHQASETKDMLTSQFK